MTPVVDLQEISKTFPGQRALDSVSFSIDSGEIHALLGENGSGKSTLIKILAGVYVPDPGARVTVAGETLAFGAPRDSSRLGLRFVHQDLGLIPELTAVENMALSWGYAHTAIGSINWREQRRRTAEMLSEFGVSIPVDQPVGTLRPVERTAVAIGRALERYTGDIRLLVLDEPTAALPPAEVEALFEILREVRSTGVSVLYVSHRLDEIRQLADRATVLRDGRLQETVEVSATTRESLIELIVGASADIIAVDGLAHPHEIAEQPAALFRVRELRSERLHDVSFDIQEGEVLGIAGLSGSGREDIAHALVGAIPSSVQIIDEGRTTTITHISARSARDLGIALVLPNRSPESAIGQFGARENVTLPSLARLSPHGLLRRKREINETTKWLEALDVRPRRSEHLYSHFSGGNQQKLIFAKWLAIEPRLLILDDPTSGVDVGARARIYELILEQARRGVGVVLISSDIEDLVSIANRVHVVARGRITETLRGSEVTEHRILEALNRTADRTFVVHGTTP